MQNIRNVAIIAHVDHGKTTLVDAFLKQSKSLADKESARELIMDSNDLERERGITIFSKNASVRYQDVKINIIDTPGHADFGGEVERVLKMADGVLLLIDAQEGPMPQTRFVLKKALEQKHAVIVVINKIDKPNARVGWALEKTYELFIDLGATSDQIEFPVIYAAAKLGKAGNSPDIATMENITPIFETIVKTIPPPSGDLGDPFQMLVAATSGDSYKGRIAIGRVARGLLKVGGSIVRIDRDGQKHTSKVTALMTFEGLARVDAEEIIAGDIVAIAGIPEANIGETLADPLQPEAIEPINIEEPTVKMTFAVNTSPVAGSEGDFCTSRNIRERLERELESDVALRIVDGASESEFIVSGRGELHLAILIERMRREGYELQVSRPEVIITTDAKGIATEPLEDVWIDAPESFSGVIIEKMGKRRAELKNMHLEDGMAHFHYCLPTRALIGYRNELLTDTRGTGQLSSLVSGRVPVALDLETNAHGSLIAFESGVSTTYGLLNAQGRGALFIEPSEKVYEGQVVGQNSKDEDLEVNVCKTKQLSNMRSKGEGTAEGLNAPRRLGLEAALEYIGDDELVEVTPKNIRIRKKLLSAIERKREKR